MLDEEEIMGREPLPPVVDDFEEEAAYEEEQRKLKRLNLHCHSWCAMAL